MLIFRVSHIDNEFLELYGGLQSHHEEKRQTHFMKRRSSTIVAGAGAVNSSGCDDGPTPESVIGIDFVKEEIDKDEVSSIFCRRPQMCFLGFFGSAHWCTEARF